MAKDWTKRFPDNASPTTSTMLFLVRRGNPKGIKYWDDLVKPGVQVIVVNPKTGGNGRYTYLAALGYMKKKGAGEAQAQEFMARLYKNVPVLARGGRDATTAFLQRNTGDVLITFESEVESVNKEFGANQVDVVYPSISILAENPVAVVERTVAKRGTGELARAYLQYLYSEEGQEIAAKHSIRPRSPTVLKKYAGTFKPIKLFTVQELFGSQSEAQKVHFNDGGLDAKVRKELRRWLRRLHDDLNVTSIFVTQEEALEVADRVVLMNGGKVEQVGSPQEVWDHPASPLVYGFLGDVSLFHGRAHEGECTWRACGCTPPSMPTPGTPRPPAT